MSIEEVDLWPILHSTALRNIERVTNDGVRFVHYTSATNALDILKGQTIWLRNIKSMNDFMELEHGVQLFQGALHFEAGTKKELWKKLDDIIPGLSVATAKKFDENIDTVRFNTYTFCLSEHDSSEDGIGRLSMWRGYGRNPAGVALVLNNTPFMSELLRDDFGVFSAIVEYMSQGDFVDEVEEFFTNIVSGKEKIQGMPIDEVAWQIAFALLTRAITMKHPGFKEEREWRVIFNDRLFPANVCERAVEKIGGVPQIVYKLPIKDYRDYGIEGSPLRELINQIIIGPSDQGYLIKDAFVEELKRLRIDSPESKILVSDIPLR